MNRADRLYSVLSDGRSHSRRDIFDAVGFMLTNNAACELRARGYRIDCWTERCFGETVSVYQLVGSLDEDGPLLGLTATTPGPSSSSEPPSSNPRHDADAHDAHEPVRDGEERPLEIHPLQPALFEAA